MLRGPKGVLRALFVQQPHNYEYRTTGEAIKSSSRSTEKKSNSVMWFSLLFPPLGHALPVSISAGIPAMIS